MQGIIQIKGIYYSLIVKKLNYSNRNLNILINKRKVGIVFYLFMPCLYTIDFKHHRLECYTRNKSACIQRCTFASEKHQKKTNDVLPFVQLFAQHYSPLVSLDFTVCSLHQWFPKSYWKFGNPASLCLQSGWGSKMSVIQAGKVFFKLTWRSLWLSGECREPTAPSAALPAALNSC